MSRVVALLATGTLRRIDAALDEVPLGLFRDLRYAVRNELLARDLETIAAESGGWPCVGIEGVQ